MKLIESNVTIIPQESGLEGIYKQCELAGRTAYKSEDKITEGSAKRFVDAMIRSNHGAVLEHGTVYLAIPMTTYAPEAVNKYKNNPYSRVHQCNNFIFKDKYGDKVCAWCITTNLRVLFENDALEDLEFLCEPTEYHEKRITSKFICSRSIAQEITRHRTMSFLMESQRYVSYNKDKFGGEITYIIPEWIKSKINDIASDINNEDLAQMSYEKALYDSRAMKDKAIYLWFVSNVGTEYNYMELIKEGCKAEEARSVLNNDCKTELIMTGFISDYEHFFDLRSRGTTGKPHPDIKILADNLLFQFECNSLCNVSNVKC